MIVKELISEDYSTASILEDTRDVWKYLAECDCLAVVDEESITIGIVTIKDLIIQRDCRNLIDCDISKPLVTPTSDIFDVLSVMDEGHFDCLPVYDNGDFLGIIKLIDITKQLAVVFNQQKIEYHKVVHDLRNPISNIAGLLQLLEETTEDKQQVLKLCSSSCDHALNILDDLIYLAGEENHPAIKAMTELNNFYATCVEEQKGLLLSKGIKIETNFTNQPYKRSIDRKQLKRAVDNLLSNAIKFSYPNSVIKVSTKREGSQLTLKILDAGIGIPQNIQTEIFNGFTTARRPGTAGEPSTGLGLSLTKRCVEDHGGTIFFKSTEGKGSKFYITL